MDGWRPSAHAQHLCCRSIVARALYARVAVRMGNLTPMVLAVLLTGVGTALLAVPMYEMLGAVLLSSAWEWGSRTGSSISLTMQPRPWCSLDDLPFVWR